MPTLRFEDNFDVIFVKTFDDRSLNSTWIFLQVWTELLRTYIQKYHDVQASCLSCAHEGPHEFVNLRSTQLF